MSASCGHELTDEQLATALKDLDLNGDGVIDYNEFKRWYFTGMKSYSGTKRTLLKFKHGYAKFAALPVLDPALAAIIEENPVTVTQDVSVNFNGPEEKFTFYKGEFNLLGPRYDEWLKKANDFKEESAYNNGDGGIMYLRIEVPVKHSAYQDMDPVFTEFVDAFNKFVEEKNKAGDTVKMSIKGKKMWLEACMRAPRETEKIPDEIRTVLMKTEQSVELEVQLGTSPQELVNRGDGTTQAQTFGEAALKGAAVKLQLRYLECLKELVQQMAPNEHFPILVAAGTKVRFSGSLGLTYDNVDELREHPVFGSFADMKLENLMPFPLDELLNYQTDLSAF